MLAFSKYILPGIGIVLGLTAVLRALGWILRHRRHHPHHFGYSLLALLLALGSVDASPAFRQITELVKSQSRDGDPDFAAYSIKSRRKLSLTQNPTWFISTAKVSSGPIFLITKLSRISRLNWAR